jgi:hypothetical protein
LEGSGKESKTAASLLQAFSLGQEWSRDLALKTNNAIDLMGKKILLALLVVFVIIQFIRPERNEGQADTPQDITHYVQVPGNVMNTLKASCYDCHSNRTNYPWYANVNPVGWWLNHHIEEGKDELNFSDFAQYDKKTMDHKLEELAEEVEEGHMPIPAYTFLHTDARLTEQQVNQLVEWVKTERQRFGLAERQ